MIILTAKNLFSNIVSYASRCTLCIQMDISLSYRMHRVQDLGELVKPAGAGGGVLPLAGNDTVKFLDVIHAELIEELLVLQAIHWNWVGGERNSERSPESDNRRAGGRLKQGTSPASFWEEEVQAQEKHQMPQG